MYKFFFNIIQRYLADNDDNFQPFQDINRFSNFTYPSRRQKSMMFLTNNNNKLFLSKNSLNKNFNYKENANENCFDKNNYNENSNNLNLKNNKNFKSQNIYFKKYLQKFKLQSSNNKKVHRKKLLSNPQFKVNNSFIKILENINDLKKNSNFLKETYNSNSIIKNKNIIGSNSFSYIDKYSYNNNNYKKKDFRDSENIIFDYLNNSDFDFEDNFFSNLNLTNTSIINNDESFSDLKNRNKGNLYNFNSKTNFNPNSKIFFFNKKGDSLLSKNLSFKDENHFIKSITKNKSECIDSRQISSKNLSKLRENEFFSNNFKNFNPFNVDSEYSKGTNGKNDFNNFTKEIKIKNKISENSFYEANKILFDNRENKEENISFYSMNSKNDENTNKNQTKTLAEMLVNNSFISNKSKMSKFKEQNIEESFEQKNNRNKANNFMNISSSKYFTLENLTTESKNLIFNFRYF